MTKQLTIPTIYWRPAKQKKLAEIIKKACDYIDSCEHLDGEGRADSLKLFMHDKWFIQEMILRIKAQYLQSQLGAGIPLIITKPRADMILGLLPIEIEHFIDKYRPTAEYIERKIELEAIMTKAKNGL